MRPLHTAIAALACVLVIPLARAHEERGHAPRKSAAPPVQKEWGIAGERRHATRTIEVTMDDRMRFTPDSVTVRHGETVRFLVRNRGRALHELVLGTRAELEAHAALMKKFPGMEHDEPYMAHVAAGRTGEIVWTFNRAGTFEFGCLVAGHYEAGMKGTLVVVAK